MQSEIMIRFRVEWEAKKDYIRKPSTINVFFKS
jgi:hypothetical protein